MAEIKTYSERIDEPTPAGGVYSITYFRDADGSPCSKEKAVHFEFVEFDKDDTVLARTYA